MLDKLSTQKRLIIATVISVLFFIAYDALFAPKPPLDFNKTVEQNQRSRFISDGFDDYIEKPIDEDKVKTTLTKYMKDLKFNKIKSSKSK